ncbi:RNA polymerase sigma factor SigJ [Actinomadura algeriensis]|uniref:RNA polymerase sigma-70 factor (ECF subfamily) n=1 Tax=Actinomadura algeriensis TaxID=1679523 RepID=A0ABR9K4I4_9ACTN|nr:RNA polymerase sigma factor SigJ [Actinomadura algeriensis]MBE1537513.1 RNA polymerase sigma-70 factor (ECF subfamily) [Actinomadura algeriensis]
MPAADVEVFEEQRPRLVGLAYRMLGSAAEAEDVVQDAYLRWSRADRVDVPAAWLTTVVTNLCLNRLALARVRRESYAGPWLPEPVLTADGTLGPLETVEQRESVSLGVLVLLERLAPAERAVFILREAFGHPHREIAEILGVSEAHSRQLHRRARAHVGEDGRKRDVDAARHHEIVESFFGATVHGDLATLERLLAEDVVALADGGGEVSAARRPVLGRASVLRYLHGLAKRPEAAALTFRIAEVNGEPAAVFWIGDVLAGVVTVTIEDGRVARIRAVVAPRKLAFAAAQLA